MSRLYKKFVNERVAGLIDEAERIRNCTIIAHIDHGKTTLADSLIAASGLLSEEVAARARLLDYDLIEQERGITIKASNITLLHKWRGKDIVVHLIDTPGHIDFSSHVTRGLRLTDGALIVVDVIEGIMVQTETVTRQAMQELVRPTLFVNKVDRLITERRLGTKKVADEITKLVREFNTMLGKYLDDDRLEEWEVSFKKGSLVIGSALDKWGIGLETLKAHAGGSESPSDLARAFVSILEDCVKAYDEEQEELLQKRYPLAPVVLDALVTTTPDPIRAQGYRVPQFWRGHENTQFVKSLMTCDKNGHCVIIIADVRPDRHAGTVATGRVLSGRLERARPLRNLRSENVDKTLQVGITMSRSRIALPVVPCGNIAFLTGLQDVAIGDTLVDAESKEGWPMTDLQYPTEAVVTYTIEPKRLSELSSIKEPIMQFVATDPALEFTVNPETGEMLLSGAGELHVEIAIEKLARQGIEVRLGEPMVLFKEQMTHNGTEITSGAEDTSQFTVRAELTVDNAPPTKDILIADASAGNYLIDDSKTIGPHIDGFEWVREAFTTLMRSGPVAGERMRRVTLRILKTHLYSEKPETTWRDVTQPLLQAARESVISGDPVLMEPWIQLEITAPEEHVGVISSILARRKGHVLQIDSERSLYKVQAEIPVRESFGLARELRTATSGWATWGARPGEYRPVGQRE
ncbi:MAG: GTP-binding protein [Candidatus Thorarchaeota archaeon]|nr:GTP-binding protein [Candidatus Thorarchaeota archaeon]